jgi:hypothetical protein
MRASCAFVKAGKMKSTESRIAKIDHTFRVILNESMNFILLSDT